MAITCPNCGETGQANDTKYCIRCGDPIPVPTIDCPVCGTLGQPGDTEFCMQCGHRLNPSPTPTTFPQGQQAQATAQPGPQFPANAEVLRLLREIAAKPAIDLKPVTDLAQAIVQRQTTTDAELAQLQAAVQKIVQGMANQQQAQQSQVQPQKSDPALLQAIAQLGTEIAGLRQQLGRQQAQQTQGRGRQGFAAPHGAPPQLTAAPQTPAPQAAPTPQPVQPPAPPTQAAQPAPPLALEPAFFCLRAEVEPHRPNPKFPAIGPLPKSTILILIQRGTLKRTSLIWREGETFAQAVQIQHMPGL